MREEVKMKLMFLKKDQNITSQKLKMTLVLKESKYSVLKN